MISQLGPWVSHRVILGVVLQTRSLAFLQKFSLKMEVGGFGGPGARGERMAAMQR